MSRRKERRREIERLFALRDREGLSLRGLAQRSGIPFGTLSWWSHRLREEARQGEREEPAPAFSEVRVVDGDLADGAAEGVDGALRLRLPGGAVVEFEGALASQVAVAVIERLVGWS